MNTEELNFTSLNSVKYHSSMKKDFLKRLSRNCVKHITIEYVRN